MTRPARVDIAEVGLRDGLQMETHFVPTDRKIAIGQAIIASGVRRIEATSFVSPRAVPALADAAEVIAGLKGQGARLSALAPNPRGAERATEAGVDEVVVFVSASETHNRMNVNRTVTESLEGIQRIADIARGGGVTLRGAVATSFGCPFEGNISPDQVARVVDFHAAAGIQAVTLGDTTGMATPQLVSSLCGYLRERFPEVRLTLHFHNTRGLGLVNVLAGLEAGIDSYESAFGGLGGCPFAAGASGNISTEDLINMLNELKVETGVDLERSILVARQVEEELVRATPGRSLPGQVMKSGPRLRLHSTQEVRPAIN